MEQPKITLEDVMACRKEMYEASTAIIAKKGRDYNRKQQDAGDTLFNMRVSTILGITKNPQQGVMVRLSDKFMRLCSLYDAEEAPANTDEGFEDSVKDFHNYLDYMVLFRREQKKQLEERKIAEDPALQADSFVQTYVDEAKKVVEEEAKRLEDIKNEVNGCKACGEKCAFWLAEQEAKKKGDIINT